MPADFKSPALFLFIIQTMNILIVQIELTEIKEINAQSMSGAESADAPKSVASVNEHPETTAHPKSMDKRHADQHPENTLNKHAKQNASSDEPSTSKSMHEHFVELPEDASSTNKSAVQYVVEQTGFSDEPSISKPDHVVEQLETMRKRQIIANTYELLNEQAAIIVALTDNESVQPQMGPINDYFMKFKQFVYALPDNSTFRNERLLRILKKIEERKEEVKFDGDNKAMLEKIREGMNGLETELRDKIATIAEGMEVIGGVVQKVIEYQVGKYVQKEYNYLLTARKNLSLPLKIISEFFGKLELSEAYLKHVEKTIRQIYLSVWTSRRYYIKVESCLVLIGAMISNVSDEVAKNLQIVGKRTEIVGQIGQNEKKVLGRNPVEHLFEIQQVAQLEGMPLTEEQVVLLYMSKCLQRAQTLLEKAIKHLKSIENDFCLINSVGIVIKSADALAKLRRNILLMKNRQ